MTDKYGVEQDPYCYPDSTVLINLLGIKNPVELAAAEVAFTRVRMAGYVAPFSEAPSIASFQTIHHHLFQDLYSWAGQIRTVDISKGSTRFATCARIVPELEKLFAEL